MKRSDENKPLIYGPVLMYGPTAVMYTHDSEVLCTTFHLPKGIKIVVPDEMLPQVDMKPKTVEEAYRSLGMLIMAAV